MAREPINTVELVEIADKIIDLLPDDGPNAMTVLAITYAICAERMGISTGAAMCGVANALAEENISERMRTGSPDAHKMH